MKTSIILRTLNGLTAISSHGASFSSWRNLRELIPVWGSVHVDLSGMLKQHHIVLTEIIYDIHLRRMTHYIVVEDLHTMNIYQENVFSSECFRINRKWKNGKQRFLITENRVWIMNLRLYGIYHQNPFYSGLTRFIFVWIKNN